MSRWSTLRKLHLAAQQAPPLPCDVEPEEELHIIVELEEPSAKGVCSKCNKHIGRGVHFHSKKCKGQ